MGRTLTLRGMVAGTIDAGISTAQQIFSYEGTDLTKGWRIVQMSCCDFLAPLIGAADGIILQTTELYQQRFDLGNSAILGIVVSNASAKSQDILDPNHVIVDSLWVSNLDEYGTSYLIIMEEVKLTPTENIIHRLKSRGQNIIPRRL